ncbi:hypothetical protein AAY473_022591, partial [Plecturocebus cupreus]
MYLHKKRNLLAHKTVKFKVFAFKDGYIQSPDNVLQAQSFPEQVLLAPVWAPFSVCTTRAQESLADRLQPDPILSADTTAAPFPDTEGRLAFLTVILGFCGSTIQLNWCIAKTKSHSVARLECSGQWRSEDDQEVKSSRDKSQ